jgi:hypothetical protein
VEVTAEVDYQVVPRGRGSRACADERRARTARLASAVAPPFIAMCPGGCLDRLGTQPRRRLVSPEPATPGVAPQQSRVFVVGAGGDRGVHPQASTVAPDPRPCSEEGTVGNAGGDEDRSIRDHERDASVWRGWVRGLF